jgi:glucose-1-phosphate thymidylyltransferase
VAVLDGDRVVRWWRSRASTWATSRSSALYLFGDSILEAADSLEPSWRGDTRCRGDAWLVDHGRTVRAEIVEGWWKDTGKPDDRSRPTG